MINFKLPFTTLLTISLFSSALLAQQSATVSQKTSQEKRTQNETTVSDENSMEIQRQQGKEKRNGDENRSTETKSDRDNKETSTRAQKQNSDRISVKMSPLALLNELFTYVEKGQSSAGATAQKIRQCALITKPRAPQRPEFEPKLLDASVEDCLVMNKEKSAGACELELKQATYNWATTGMPTSIRVPARELIADATCWITYGLVAEATMDALSSGQEIPSSSNIKIGLANALSKQLRRTDLPEKANRIAIRQMGDNCVIPTTRGYQFEGRYEWSCGSFSVDPKNLTATIGELTVYGRSNSLFGETWDLETSKTSDVLFASSNSRTQSIESSTTNARYSGTDNRSSNSRNLSMRTSERLQSEELSNLSNSAETGFSISQPGIKGAN